MRRVLGALQRGRAATEPLDWEQITRAQYSERHCVSRNLHNGSAGLA